MDRKSKLADTTEVKIYFFFKNNKCKQYLNQLSDTRSGDPLVLRFPNFIPIGKKTWTPWAILVSDWLKKSSPLKLGSTMNSYFVVLYDVWEILYKIFIHISCRSDN